MTTTTTGTDARHADKKTAVGTTHVIDVNDQADGHSARCLCGWVSDSLWSRRRAAEAGRGHLRSP
jgi:hypothetical protein